MHWAEPIAAGLIFAVWHSFADALAWRIYTAYYAPSRKQITDKTAYLFSAHSRCEFCSAQIPWYGLIPFAGYFLVRGRCVNCTRPLSMRFPVFEAIAFFYGGVAAVREIHPAAFGVLLLVYLLLWIVITVDYRSLFIPTEAILGLLVAGLIQLLLIRHTTWYRFDSLDLGLDLAVAFVWYFLFHLLRILSGYKMGLADVRLVLALGLLLGHPLALYLPGLAAALAIVFYLLRRRSVLIYAPSETQIPFGVFLGMGFLVLNLFRSNP